MTEKIKLPYMNSKVVAEEIGKFIVEKALEIRTTGGVIGLSGGVDSTTVAGLTKKAFDKHNLQNPSNPLELVGYILPSVVNPKKDEEDAIKVAEKLGIRYEIIPISSIVDSFKISNSEALNNNFHKGNLMSRVRANILSTKGATENKLVIGTGNKDEDFGIGYYTLFGDGAVHLSPIGALSKRLVREMASYLGFEDLANRVPSAGLEVGQTDFKDLGYEYSLVELVIEGKQQGLTLDELIKNSQIIKEVNSKLNESKFDNVISAVEDVLKRHKIAINKMQIIHPPTPKITLEYR